jgi:hypothetical protein
MMAWRGEARRHNRIVRLRKSREQQMQSVGCRTAGPKLLCLSLSGPHEHASIGLHESPAVDYVDALRITACHSKHLDHAGPAQPRDQRRAQLLRRLLDLLRAINMTGRCWNGEASGGADWEGGGVAYGRATEPTAMKVRTARSPRF